MRTFAIGDVQGCADALDELLSLIKFDPKHDQLWFAGDLVNRGPDSVGVLRRVRDLGDRAISVLGNHDLHLLALAFGNQQKEKSNPGLEAVLNAPDGDELIDWLLHRPMIHTDDEIGFSLIHAGLAPQWDIDLANQCGRELEQVLRGPAKQRNRYFSKMYGNQPDHWSIDLQGQDRLRFITNSLTRMRYLNTDGSMDFRQKGPPKTAPVGLIPWFKHPQRCTQHELIVCGHWSTLGYRASEGVYSIDTGCLWGGELTALQIYPHIERFSLPCPSAA